MELTKTSSLLLSRAFSIGRGVAIIFFLSSPWRVFDGSRSGHGVANVFFRFFSPPTCNYIYAYTLHTEYAYLPPRQFPIAPARRSSSAVRPSVRRLYGTTRARRRRRDTARRRPVPRRTEQRSPLCIAPRSSARRRRRFSARSLDQSAGSPPPPPPTAYRRPPAELSVAR